MPTASFTEMADMITEVRQYALVAARFENLMVASGRQPSRNTIAEQEQVLLDAFTTSANPIKVVFDKASDFCRNGFAPVRRSVQLLKEMYLDTFKTSQGNTVYQDPDDPNGMLARQGAIDEWFESRIVHSSRKVDEKVKGFFSNHPSPMTDWCTHESAEEDDEV